MLLLISNDSDTNKLLFINWLFVETNLSPENFSRIGTQTSSVQPGYTVDS